MTDAPTRWLTLSAEDSRRFQRRVVRGRIEQMPPPPGALEQEIALLQAELAIVRLPAGMIAPIHALIASGFLPIHADTLVYHARRLDAPVASRPATTGFSAGLADQADRARIAQIARAAFSAYRSHYHANPLLDADVVAEGYAEWATSFLDARAQERETWVVRIDGEVAGFATCALSAGGSAAEIVLNAVDPARAGRGAYGYLLGTLLQSYQARGCSVVSTSTQVWNYVVQRAWARAGFVLTHAYDTYHINVPAGGDR